MEKEDFRNSKKNMIYLLVNSKKKDRQWVYRMPLDISRKKYHDKIQFLVKSDIDVEVGSKSWSDDAQKYGTIKNIKNNVSFIDDWNEFIIIALKKGLTTNDIFNKSLKEN